MVRVSIRFSYVSVMKQLNTEKILFNYFKLTHYQMVNCLLVGEVPVM
jgi:hypothetical protein